MASKDVEYCAHVALLVSLKPLLCYSTKETQTHKKKKIKVPKVVSSRQCHRGTILGFSKKLGVNYSLSLALKYIYNYFFIFFVFCVKDNLVPFTTSTRFHGTNGTFFMEPLMPTENF